MYYYLYNKNVFRIQRPGLNSLCSGLRGWACSAHRALPSVHWCSWKRRVRSALQCPPHKTPPPHRTVLCTSLPSSGKKLAKNCNKTRLFTLHMFLLPLLQLEACQSEWKYFSSLPSIHWWLQHLCPLVYIPAPKPYNTSQFPKRTHSQWCIQAHRTTRIRRKKTPTLSLRDDERDTADTHWLPSDQENNPQTLQLPGNKMLNVRQRRMDAFPSV